MIGPGGKAHADLRESPEITVDPPPPLPEARGTLRLIPVVMAVAMLAAVGWLYRIGAQTNPNFLMLPILVLGSVTATVAGTRAQRRSGRIDADRTRYLRHLAVVRRKVIAAADAQRTAAGLRHPDPEALWRRVGSTGMWRLRPGGPGFGTVRIGLGEAAPVTRLTVPENSGAEIDPVTDIALRQLIELHATVPGLPLTVDAFDADGPISVDGDAGAVRRLLRAVICQLALSHPPGVLLIGSAGAEFAAPGNGWEWLKWLPHHRGHGAGSGHLDYPDLLTAAAALGGMRVRPSTCCAVVLTEEAADPEVLASGVAVIQIGGDRVDDGGIRLSVEAGKLTVRRGADRRIGVADGLSAADALMFARRLAAHRPDDNSEPTGWLSLMGIDDPGRIDPERWWSSRSRSDTLRVPIGVRTDGPGGRPTPLLLDIKEAAAGGTGPHGLCVGATGSGKSEFLRTVVLGMVVRHSPDELNLVLVDFKGGATFHGLDRLHHVAAVITNLAEDGSLVERMRDALDGELHRRQELLRGAGGFDSVTAYRAYRAESPRDARMQPLPTLLVIVDEFTELLGSHPDFADMFAAIGRLGRSLGIHLLLASQRLEEGRLRGLEAHLSYRICLKTLSAAESRLVLGIPDAYELPPTPGRGYLRTADGTLSGFHTAYVSGPAPRSRPAANGCAVRPFLRTRFDAAAPLRNLSEREKSLLQTILDRLAGRGDPAREIWLPPLGPSEPLMRLIDTAHAELTVPIGLVDRPFEQCREPLWIDMSGADGHIAVVGAPQSGKSTALATIMTALAATHSPRRIQFYVLDFGGGALRGLGGLPHVAAAAGRFEPELTHRIIAQIETVVNHRDNRPLAEHDAHVVLMVDGWPELCAGFGNHPGGGGGAYHDDVESRVAAIVARGLSCGVHVAISAARWGDIRPALRDRIGSRIELRLGDPADSIIDRNPARHVPKDQAGRGITGGGLHMRIARPDLGAPSGTPPEQLLAHAVAVLRRRYPDDTAPAVRILPRRFHHRDLTAAGDDARRPLLGLAESDLAPVVLDFERHPQLLVIGENECGKTATLRLMCREIVRTHTPQQARLAVLDYRRGLLGVVPETYSTGQAAYAITPDGAAATLAELYRLLDRRRPGPDVTREQLRHRSWWSGPQLYLIIDDHDLVTAPADNTLARLVEYLPHAGDLGLKVIVARRSGGASRAMYDPVLSMMRDLGAAVLMMSADPDDGPLPGSARPTRLPPGRATLSSRDRQQHLHVAWSPPC